MRTDTPPAHSWRGRLRFQVALGVNALVALSISVTIFATTRIVTRRSLGSATDQLGLARSAFDHLTTNRAESIAAQVRLITSLPVFRAHMSNPALATDRATLEAMVDEYRPQLGARFAILSDAAGTWTIRSGWPDGAPLPAPVQAGIHAALGRQSHHAVVAVLDHLYVVVSEPAAFGEETLGALTIGIALDDAVARELADVTHSEINFMTGNRVSGSSLDPGSQLALTAMLGRGVPDGHGSVALVALGRGLPRYVAGSFSLADRSGDEASNTLVLMQDWGPTQVFLDGLRRQLLEGSVVVLAFALAGGLWFSSYVARPLSDVAEAAAVMAAGDWGRDVPVRGSTEAATMATAFNEMAGRLRVSHARLWERTEVLEAEILEREHTELRLVVAKAAAEQASAAKSAFLANMSHELRTPLNSIIGYSEMLKEQAEGSGHVEYVSDLDKVVGAGRHLLTLISDVLDLARIEAGRTDLVIEACDIDALVASVVSAVQPLARARGNQLIVHDAGRVGIVRTDETKVRQVLLNLLSNACKFTRDGDVRVTARRGEGDATDWLTLEVADTGIGLTPEQVGRLFQDFSQADTSTTRQYGGAGLGLAISQRLCHLMGGAITVDSRIGVGSTFTARVPVDPCDVPATGRDASAGSTRRATGSAVRRPDRAPAR